MCIRDRFRTCSAPTNYATDFYGASGVSCRLRFPPRRWFSYRRESEHAPRPGSTVTLMQRLMPIRKVGKTVTDSTKALCALYVSVLLWCLDHSVSRVHYCRTLSDTRRPMFFHSLARPKHQIVDSYRIRVSKWSSTKNACTCA